MKYAWIKQHTDEFPVAAMCRFLSVSRSAYYDWLEHSPTAFEKEDAELIEIIKDLFKNSRENYGTRRLKKDLRKKAGISAGDVLLD